MSSLPFPGVDRVGGFFDRDLFVAFERLELAIANAKADAGTREGSERLATARIEAARAIEQVPWSELPYTVAVRALALIRALRKVGAYDELFASAVTDEFAETECNLPGVLAMMLVSPAWRWAAAPLFSEVPNWMWEAYAEWLFAAPHRPLSAVEADQCAEHLSRHATELARWVECNLGSASIRQAAETFIKVVSLAPLAPMNTDLRPLAQTRAQILMRIIDQPESPSAPAISLRQPDAPQWGQNRHTRGVQRNQARRRTLKAA